MPMVRTFQQLDGSIRVMVPNPKMRLAGESESAFVDRICVQDQAKDPTLAGATFTDVEAASLPPRTRLDLQGDPESCRNAWRRVGTAVRIDEAAILPNYAMLLSRLRAVMTPIQKVRGALELLALETAIKAKDVPTTQAAFDALTARPEITPAVRAEIQRTFREKKIPVTGA